MAKKRISKKIKKIYKSQNQNSSSPIIQGITYSNIKFIKNNHKNIIIYLNLIQNKKYILAASEYKITLHDSKTYNKLSENKIINGPLTEIIELTNGTIVAISDTDYSKTYRAKAYDATNWPETPAQHDANDSTSLPDGKTTDDRTVYSDLYYSIKVNVEADDTTQP